MRRHTSVALLALCLLTCSSAIALAEPLELTIADYRLLDSQEPDRFEPSAAVVSVDGERVFLFNDKSLDLMPTVWHIGENDALTYTAYDPAHWPIDKIEAATREADLYWVLTSCSKGPVNVADNWQLLAMSEPVPGQHPEVVDYSAFLHAGLATFLRDRGYAWAKLEGLALSPNPGCLLMGVREVALPATYDPVTEESTAVSRFVCGILELDLNDWGRITPLLWIEDTCEPAEQCYGVGSLELDPDGRTLWLTMNFEAPGDKRAAVSGRLYQIGYNELGMYNGTDTLAQFLGVPWAIYEGKAESLAFLPDGRLLMVFDQDDDRKGGPDSEKKFPLTSRQDYYVILDVAW